MTGKEFKRIRKLLGLSQQGMGRAIGHLDGRQVRYYESGARPIPPIVAILMKIYRYLGKVPDFVLD